MCCKQHLRDLIWSLLSRFNCKTNHASLLNTSARTCKTNPDLMGTSANIVVVPVIGIITRGPITVNTPLNIGAREWAVWKVPTVIRACCCCWQISRVIRKRSPPGIPIYGRVVTAKIAIDCRSAYVIVWSFEVHHPRMTRVGTEEANIEHILHARVSKSRAQMPVRESISWRCGQMSVVQLHVWWRHLQHNKQHTVKIHCCICNHLKLLYKCRHIDSFWHPL